MNINVRLNFNKNFTKKSIYESHKQYREPTHSDASSAEYYFQQHPNGG